MNLLNTNRRWFWPSEAALICQVSRMTIYRWIEEGKISTILKSRPFKIPRAEIEKLLR